MHRQYRGAGNSCLDKARNGRMAVPAYFDVSRYVFMKLSLTF